MSSIIFSRYHSHCFFLTNVRWRPSLPYGSKSRVQLISPPFSPLRFGVTCSTNRRDDGFCGKGYGDGGVRFSRKEEVTEIADGEELGLRGSFKRSIWQQAKDIAVFAASAGGLWICGPMMSLIDTAVVGQSSSVELAALGPGTVVCDYMSYIFMFLSIATSNMVATSLARKDRDEAQEHISMLLFLALACGFGMLFLMKFFGTQILSAFIGPKNLHLIPAATSYIQIRGLAWPAVLVGMVAQSASLGMKDSFGPLKVLLIASAANGFGDIFLCCFFHHGIAGAAWATMVSQFIAAILMVESLNKSGFNALALSVPSPLELLRIIELAAPVFVTMFSKVAFYSLLTYFATSMGTITLAAHQVMIGVYSLCAVWGEPLSQTAQSFMPELMSGVNRSLEKRRYSAEIIVSCDGRKKTSDSSAEISQAHNCAAIQKMSTEKAF